MSLDAAVRLVQERTSLNPKVAIVLGSGLGELGGLIQHCTRIPYSDIPGFPRSTAHGHAGNLLMGYMGGVPLVAMQGRAHLYEGHSLEKTVFPIQVMGALGAETLIVSNASGGVNPRYHSGDIVLIDSHLDFLSPTRRTGRNESPAEPFSAVSFSHGLGVPMRSREVYDDSLMTQAQRISCQIGFSIERGTYLGTKGPTYETRAEYRFFRKIGADLVGMSTIPEVILASQIGMRVLAFSVVTNVANPDAITKTTHEEVLDFGLLAQEKLTKLLQAIFNEWSGPPD